MLSRVQSGLSQMWRFVIFLVESVQRHTYSKLLAICSVDFMYLITLGCIILMLIIHRNVSKQLHQSVSTADISADIFGASRAFFCVYLSVCGYELIMTSLI